jgi:hypothetical protein
MGPTRTISSALAAMLVSVVFAGCAEVYLHTSSAHRYPAYPPTCRVRLVASDPGQDFEEIGTLSVDGDPRAFRNPNFFLQEAREQVCRAGGELVVTQVNGFGSIVRGVVFRRTGENAELVDTSQEECDPICSPGFVCKETKCIPVCNPACDASEVCGRDRLCHARPGNAAN